VFVPILNLTLPDLLIMVWSLGKSLPICNAWLSGGIRGHSQILVLNRFHFKCRGLLPCTTTAESRGFAPLPVRAVSSDDSTSDAAKQFEELYADLKAKWDGLENKTTVVVYAGGALVALWLSSTIVGAINSVPLLPKIMELVGLTYTGWFVYRYLLFKSSRKELVEDIEELKRKVTGASTEESF
jgi:hypothetical protein